MLENVEIWRVPECGKQGASDQNLEVTSREFRDSRDSRDSSGEKTPFVITAFPFPRGSGGGRVPLSPQGLLTR